MSTDQQFTATGPSATGFQTTGSAIDVGANVTGTSAGGVFHATASGQGKAVAGVTGDSAYGSGFLGGNANDDSTSPDRPRGVFGESDMPGGIGVEGFGASFGVAGQLVNDPDTIGFIAGRDHIFHELAGVFGASAQAGVFGNSEGHGGTGVHGRGGGVGGFGVRGEIAGSGGAAVKGQVFGSGSALAGQFIGNGGSGVLGITNSSLAPGTAPGGLGDPNIQAGVLGQNDGQGYGVKGISKTIGIFGQSIPPPGSSGTGVVAFGGGSTGTGLLAIGSTGVHAGGANLGIEADCTKPGVAVYAHSFDPEGGIETLGVKNLLTVNNGVVAYGQTNGLYALSLHGAAVSGLVLDGTAIAGRTQGKTATSIAVFGIAPVGDSQALAGRFDGNVDIRGTLHKSGGGFRIDHPLEPMEKHLNHSFVESSDRKNIYDGVAVLDANGQAIVDLPAWFPAVNTDFRYQLTCLGGFAPVYIGSKLRNNRFIISGGTAGMEVSWQVTGVRSDFWALENPVCVEEVKNPHERGKYRHPLRAKADNATGPHLDLQMSKSALCG